MQFFITQFWDSFLTVVYIKQFWLFFSNFTFLSCNSVMSQILTILAFVFSELHGKKSNCEINSQLPFSLFHPVVETSFHRNHIISFLAKAPFRLFVTVCTVFMAYTSFLQLTWTGIICAAYSLLFIIYSAFIINSILMQTHYSHK